MSQVNVAFKFNKTHTNNTTTVRKATSLNSTNVKTNGRKKKKLRKKRVAGALLILSLPIILITMIFGGRDEAEALKTKTDKTVKNHVETKVSIQETKKLSIAPKQLPVEKKKPQIMTEAQFEKQARSYVEEAIGLQPDHKIYSLIYKYSLENGIAPYHLLGVGWKETNFKSVTGPSTRYGTAKGMYQFIDTTAVQLGFKPEDMYKPEVAIKAAAMLLREYSNAFAGIRGKVALPESFDRFKADGKYAMWRTNKKDQNGNYIFIPVADQNGQKIPRLLLATMSYNCGPGKISSAMDRYGKVYVNPNVSERSLPHQTLGYVVLINKYFYNFEYKFDYNYNDVDKVLASNNQ